MRLKMCGVYKITNLITNEIYVGCSVDIKRRWADHITRSKYLNKSYYKKLYIAFREYGIDQFTFEVLEECEPDKLRDLEKHYISKLDAYGVGYNVTISLQNHPNAKLTIDDVIDIRTRYNMRERKKDVYKDYSTKIDAKGFHKVWNGYTWNGVMPEVYTASAKEYHTNNTGQQGSENGRATLTGEDVIRIRHLKKLGKTRQEVYKDYEDKVTFGSFTNTWYGYNWKHIKV